MGFFFPRSQIRKITSKVSKGGRERRGIWISGPKTKEKERVCRNLGLIWEEIMEKINNIIKIKKFYFDKNAPIHQHLTLNYITF